MAKSVMTWGWIEYNALVSQDPSSESPMREDATLLLRRMSEGDDAAANALLPLVYDELRARAGAYFRGQPADHTLQPTALVHEAYVRLVKSPPGAGWQNRAHFCAVAATAMRQVLINHAKRRARGHVARSTHRDQVTALVTPSSNTTVDVLALDEALTRLAKLDARHARIVELRFFGGMTLEEISDVLSVSLSTVEKEWRRLRAWLLRELRDEDPK